MIELDACKTRFVALKLHFTSNYDYVKYSGTVRRQAINKNEKWAVSKICKKYENEDAVFSFFLSTMLDMYGRNGKIETYIGHYASPDAFDNFDKNIGWWKSLSDNFRKDVPNIFDAISIKESENHPQIFVKYLDKEANFNTLVAIVLALPKVIEYWRTHSADTILFGEYLNFFDKYVSLVPVEKRKKIKEKIL